MKIKSNIITTAILCLFSIIAMAKELSVFSVNIADKNTVALQITNVSQPEIQVTLKDASGVIMFDELITQNNVNYRKYDLKNLPSGQYTLMATYDNTIKVQAITKRNENLEIESDQLQTIFQPVFRQHSDYLDLNMLCLSHQNISIEMRDGEGRIIFKEQIKDIRFLQKRFNLSKLNQGTYSLRLEIDGKVINKEFKQSINWSPSVPVV